MKKSIGMLCVLAAVMSVASVVNASAISYTADPGPATDPTLSGWNFVGEAAYNQPIFFHGTNSWFFGDSATSIGMFTYDATAIEQTNMKDGGWEASWNMEPYSASSANRLLMQVGDGEKLFRLSYIKDDGVYLMGSGGAYTRVSDIASGVSQLSGMSYDPADGGVLTVTVGGVPVVTQARADAFSYADVVGVGFGNGTIAKGSALINSMDFTISEVPEPATLSLLALGMGLLGVKKKK